MLDTGAVSRGSGNQGSNKKRDARQKVVEADLVDRLILIRAPVTLGGQGLDAFADFPLASVLARFTPVEEETLGPDRLTVYEKRGKT